MKRFVDPLFFLVLLAIDVVLWISTYVFGSVPPSVIVMAPGFVSLTLLALGRAYMNLDAKKFYAFVAPAGGVFALSMWLTELLTPPLESYDFTAGALVMVVCGIGALLGLFLALVGAIASPELVRTEQEQARAEKAQEKARLKQEQKEQRKAAKQARQQ